MNQVTDANGKTTGFTYDWGVRKNTITPAYTIARSVVASGLVTSVVRRGFTTTFGYDTLFRITSISPPAGANFSYSYDNSQGRFVLLTRGISNRRTDLDGFGRPSATSNAVNVKTDMTYDACGRMTYQSYPFEGTANKGTTYRYDPLGRVTRKIHPDGEDVRFDYTGLDVQITNERGIDSSQRWDGYGDPAEALLVGVVDRDGQTWSYDYDILGNLLLVDPPGGTPNRAWTYNTKSQLTSESHPETGTVNYGYYANGKLQTKTDPAFGTTTYTYDNNNRLTHIDFPGASFTDLDYDASDNGTLLENEAVRSTFTYDGANRLDVRRDLHKSGPFTLSVDYDYDTRDNLQFVTYPRESGTRLRIQYSYDGGNRIARIAQVGGAATVYARSIQYHPSGGIKQYVAGNGYTNQFQYHPNRYFVTNITDQFGAEEVLDLLYTYDPAGNVDTITDARPGMSQEFTYDSLDRLEQAGGPWGVAEYGYDGQGNRTSQTIGNAFTTYTYSGATNRLTRASGANPDTFTYDGNGNLRTTARGTFVYSPENLVTSSTISGVAASYRYDGNNLRKSKASGGRTVHFFHAPEEQLLSEFESSGAMVRAPLRDYIHAGNRLIASVKYSGAGPATAQKVEYYHLDALGSVRAVTDASGAIVVRHDYEPYGVEWNQPQSADSRRFTGKERDPESGLDYFGARYYSAPVARFTSVDPDYTWSESLADPERWNRYSYARNNPLRYRYSDGRFSTPAAAWVLAEVDFAVHGKLGTEIVELFAEGLADKATTSGTVDTPARHCSQVRRRPSLVRIGWSDAPTSTCDRRNSLMVIRRALKRVGELQDGALLEMPSHELDANR